jgi:signal transduction histidine kinase
MKIRLDGLTLQLLALVILPFSVLLVGVSLFSVRVHEQAMRRLVAERDQRAARAAAAALSEQLHHREAAVRNLSARLAEGALPATLLESASFLDADFDGGMAVISSEGESIASSMPDADWETRLRPNFLSEILAAGYGFSAPIEVDGEILMMAGAAAGDSAVLGAFSVSSMMHAATLTSGSSAGWSAFLVDEGGLLLEFVGDVPPSDMLLEHAGVQAALRGEYGSSFLPAGDRKEHVAAFSPVSPVGWALVIEEPWEEVSSPLLDISLIAPLTLIPALLLSIVALWFGARRVIKPLRILEEQAAAIAEGDFEAIEEPLESIGEIQSLQAKIEWMARQMHQYQQALQRYIGSITTAQEEERSRLARELHDETIQDLIAIDQRVQLAGMDGETAPPSDPESLAELHDRLQIAIQGLRRMIRGLRPIYLEDLGLVAALDMLARDVEAEIGHPVDFAVKGTVRRFDPQTELGIYRIAQEALSNVGKHASSKRLDVRVSFAARSFTVRIDDDGIGFEGPSNLRMLGASEHFGLLGMYERAELIGAELSIQSNLGRGTSIQLELPLQAADE